MDKLSDKFGLIDRFGRRIDYLRISVTDRCSLRCVYCMPAEGIAHKSHDSILSFEEIKRIAMVAVRLGIKKIRITGGEPLVRKGLHLLIRQLHGIIGLNEIALTTNGVYLAERASLLKRCGLGRVNISLDSLNPERFKKITRGGDIKMALDGIESALKVGLAPVKINTVLLKGFNVDEISSFANLARSRPIHIRFIEYMPTDLGYSSYERLYFSAGRAKEICGKLGILHPLTTGTIGTAKIFRIDGFCGTIGFISPMSEPFCHSCNKLRLTADGRLRSCLHMSKAVDVKKAMRGGALDEGLARLFKEAVKMKPLSHNLPEHPVMAESENFSMCQIGG